MQGIINVQCRSSIATPQARLQINQIIVHIVDLIIIILSQGKDGGATIDVEKDRPFFTVPPAINYRKRVEFVYVKCFFEVPVLYCVDRHTPNHMDSTICGAHGHM